VRQALRHEASGDCLGSSVLLIVEGTWLHQCLVCHDENGELYREPDVDQQ